MVQPPRLIGATRANQAGLFTGYSAPYVAEALGLDDLLVAYDVSAEWTDEPGLGPAEQ